MTAAFDATVQRTSADYTANVSDFVRTARAECASVEADVTAVNASVW